ncbi:hypothetical protein [Rhodococcus qingshengii]|uniref:Uncharacterized protein n=1 Tax=Gordonia cholesterolivorans TaxID=559625 RepID=A0ABN3I297_9ACTN|nr:hypothetical protein [Rhodococcus qingshengii]AUH67747.1 hypothetical protein CXX93_04575 [Gordonia sp. YC-JH1]MCZ4618463.1 hypothetical protein [Rhodococcus qingshengii]
MSGPFTEGMLEPLFDSLEQLVALRENSRVDEQITQSVQSIARRALVEQFMAQGLVVGSLSELVKQLRTAGASMKPAHHRRRIGDVGEDGN